MASATGNLPAGDVRGTSGHGDEVYLSVDRMPAFPGGEAALMTYLRDNISYPPEAEEKNIQGKVIVQFVVDSVGYVGDVKVVRSVDPNLESSRRFPNSYQEPDWANRSTCGTRFR